MASNDRVNLSAYLGANVPLHIQEQLAEAVTRAIQHPDADLEAILQRAKTIAERAVAGEIQNVLHYATKALFAVAKKKRRDVAAEPLVFRASEYFDDFRFGDGDASAIEAHVLLEELLATLSPTERDVYRRRLEGWTHQEISQQLGISTDNSRTYFSRARRMLMNRLRPKR
jgi:RNA polymerase sigma factor (sigma-70 family)